jgi:hypothetical protein
MNLIIAAGLLLGSPTANGHRIEIDHRGQRVDVTYRSDMDVAHKQVGTVGAPGRASTLRCAWKARVSVQREARSAAGHVLTRTIASDVPIEGTRPGWCAGQRNAIAQEVAARSSDVRDHLLAVAERDREALALELDAVHSPARS